MQDEACMDPVHCITMTFPYSKRWPDMHGNIVCSTQKSLAALSSFTMQVLKELFEGPFFYREGGSIPALALMKKHLGIWCTSFGFGLATDNLHSPNERYQVSMWDKGREAWIKLLHEMSVEESGTEEQAEPGSSTASKDEL